MLRDSPACHPAPPSSNGPLKIKRPLWNRINEAVGGSVRLRRTLLLEDDERSSAVVVVVVEPRGLPDLEEMVHRFGLTPREGEVAHLMADRLSNNEIAKRLGLSIHTARRHSEKILSKLEIHSRKFVRDALLDPNHSPALRYVGHVS